MMRDHFEGCAAHLDTLLREGEHYLAWFEGEESDFVRFNQGRVRQAGSVKQLALEVRLLSGHRHASAKLTLTGDGKADHAALNALTETLRAELPALSEDPYLLYSNSDEQSHSVRPGQRPGATEVIEQIAHASRDTDLVGIHAAGPIARGFASSFGGRRWHETHSHNFDFSLYLVGDKAVKSRYAGFEWDYATLRNKIEQARAQLAVMGQPARILAPGKYRAYVAPAAMAEIAALLAWGGFGVKAQRTSQSPLLRLAREGIVLSWRVSISEHTAAGLAPDFEAQGFGKPAVVPLITHGRMANPLVSPRSAREFGLATTGANSEETPEALDMSGGDLAADEVLKRLGTGIYINNLWYLNYSDRSAGKMTGMTRFATLWVENGEIVAPVNAMRFDESLYRMLGENLDALTCEREYLIDPSSYGSRSTQSWRLPGALVRDLTLTL
jgi:predicted Zn-dependent protease